MCKKYKVIVKNEPSMDLMAEILATIFDREMTDDFSSVNVKKRIKIQSKKGDNDEKDKNSDA